MCLTRCAVPCRVYRQMKVPWQITLTGVVLLCSVIHYITKQQMYENVRILPIAAVPTVPCLASCRDCSGQV